MLTTYTTDAREDITDVDHLRDVLDELVQVLDALNARIQALEDAARR